MLKVVRSLVALAALAGTLAVAGPALAAPADTGAPSNVRGFLLRSNDGAGDTNTFPRTPAFAWDPVPGARIYEFQLSTSRTFAENAIVWEDSAQAPVMTVPVTLPWITGARYSWYARVRAYVNGAEGPWSAPYGFNLRAPGAPRSLSSGTNPKPGLIRWTPVEGATAYEVVFLYDQGQGKAKRILTATTSADLREYYTLHNGQDWANVIYWRVRAVRVLQGKPKNAIPVASYGPWSARNRTVEPPMASGQIVLGGTVSRATGIDVVSSTTTGAPGPGPHQLVPGFWWSGMLGPTGESFGLCPQIASIFGITCPLYHVYVYSDVDCVNRVHVSDLIGSPAYVPRLSGPLALPTDAKELGKAAFLWLGDSDEGEGDVFDAGDDPVLATGTTPAKDETAPTTTPTTTDGSGSGATDGTTDGSTGGTTDGSTTTTAGGKTLVERKTGLWDVDWPTGRYYWTVVPAIPHLVSTDGDAASAKVEWRDVVFGQDMCADGRVMVFGKTSQVVATAESGVPYASGMSVEGTLKAATEEKPRFFGKVVVGWKPTPGARRYEVQWSRRDTRWRTEGKVTTPGTQALLELAPGRWYYRIRGLDATLPGANGLTWSDPVEIQIEAPKFTVIGRSK